MAQVQETLNKGLKREFVIKDSQTDVEKKILAKLEEFGREARLPGFRPGKVPMPVLKKRFGASARSEVIDQMVSTATQKTLSERNLRAAAEPQIELVSFGEGQDLEFKLAVEILPEITQPDFSALSLERVTADVSDEEVTEAITRVAKQVREPEVVTEKRGAKMGDVLVINFDGTVDGERQPGMKGDDHRLELGSKSFIDTFEEQLVGAKVGDKKTIKVSFPANYHAENLSGKKAEFAVEVKELRASKPAELNDELAKQLGVESLAELQKRVKEDLGADYARISRAVIKRHLLDELAKKTKFELPAGMVENEFNGIWRQVEEGKKRGELDKKDEKKSDDELKKEYRSIAERRIRLGLLLAEVARTNKLEVSSTELRDAMIAEARRFPGQEKAVIEYYTKTEGAVERLRAPLLEEKVIDHILSKAKVTEKKIASDKLRKLPEEMD